MTKTYVQIQKQIETLQREADKLKRKEIDDVIAKIKEAIAVYELTAADLGFARGAAKAGAAPRKRGRPAATPGAAAARVRSGCATRSARASRCRTSPSDAFPAAGGRRRPMAMTRCLVVDDDPELLQSVCDYLRRFGLEPVPAASAAEMRARLAEGGIDLVVLDVMLPDADGLALLGQLRQDARLAVIMLTAQGDPGSRVLGLELGADDYVTKPFEPRELVARIKAVLRRRAHPGDAAGRPDGMVEFAGWRFDRLKRQLV